MTKEDFEELIQEIVIEVYPSEKTAFSISKKKVFNDLYTNQLELVSINEQKGEFNFIEEAKLVLQFIPVMITTYKFVKEYLKSDKANNEIEHVKKEWEKKLIQKGISTKEAEKIVNNFSQKMVKKLSKKDGK